jgi:glycosyltransferase involved in cell wall biosynthesis
MGVEKNTILIPIQNYLPGYKGGGPVRSIANLVEMLGDEVAFLILTSDRDFGDTIPYLSLKPNIWQMVGKAQVMYLSSDRMNIWSWVKYFRQTEHDLIYLNSFFSPHTRRTLLLRWLGLIPQRPVILAPRGEFSPGALGLKALKKRVYIRIALRMGLYRDLTWHITSNSEKTHLQSALTNSIKDSPRRIVLAPNLASPPSLMEALHFSAVKQSQKIRIVFLSRLARMKNLDFVLTILQNIRCAVILDIYGPKEDMQYWQECEQIIHSSPTHIQVTYHGAIASDQVSQVIAQYHLFFLPTRGENFGHVIVEAWAAGCPVLISDQTPWRDLEAKGIGWDLPLTEPERFQQVIEQVAAMDQQEFSQWSERAKQFAATFVQEQNQAALEAYRHLFHLVASSQEDNV